MGVVNADQRRPNILLVVSDQERARGWIPDGMVLPHRQRLIDEGLEFTRFYAHASPCSPSRASLFTGWYVPQHGVVENVIWETHRELDPAIPTLGHLLRGAGYRTAYLGKWHLALTNKPDMEAYGFSDWDGDDRHFMGWAGTGWHFDPVIAAQAADWLGQHAGNGAAGSGSGEPWFLTVALVNPHDVMWFPIDQSSYQDAHDDEVHLARQLLESSRWKDDETLPAFPERYDEVFDALPANFDDDLHTKPAVQRQWLWEQQHFLYGYLDPSDTGAWLRHLDYYWKLHQGADESLGVVLDALDASGAADDTIVIFTSDHGDMCGSHGLRSKGPFVYEEIMRIPLYVRVPGMTEAGTATEALATHVDLARTIAELAGVSEEHTAGLPGVDLSPVMASPAAPGRDHVLFAQDTGWYERCMGLRYAIRGIFDGRFKYARYYGVGGGTDHLGRPSRTPKLFDVDAAFEDHDHELYDLQEDPHELVNLAMDRGRRAELREWFDRLRAAEAAEFADIAGAGGAGVARDTEL
jgi:arylsulfatase